MKPKKKEITRKKTIAEQEASLFPKAKISKEAYNRGYDLGRTGMIRSLLNFIATSTFKPVTKKTKKTLSLNFNETGDKWIEDLQEECNTPDNAEYYEGWNTGRSFACERDTLNENHPDFQVFGGKITVHNTINNKLNKMSEEIDIDEAEFYGYDEDYYNRMADAVGNIELEEEVIF